jgi:RNA polymerase sigma factor (sigma-70 family)
MTTGSQSDIDAWIENATRWPILEPEEVIELGRRIQSLSNDDATRSKAVNKLVLHNLRLVIHLVRRFMATSHKRWGGAETVDYLQVGAIGLQRAAEMYDPARGYNFSTYAMCWIRSTVSRYNMKTLTPVHVSESMSRQIVFYKRNGYMQSKRTGEAINDAACQAAIRATSLAYDYVSLDATGISGAPLVDSIQSPSSTDAGDGSFMENAWRTLSMTGANETEIRVLIDSAVRGKTIQEIADDMGTTIHRVKLFKKKAINKAKAHRSLVLSGIM